MNRIIDSNPDLKFIPLSNYSMNEVIQILSQSKIYLDFGFHPGVDHLPREAAILKNCILTNKEGSAYYSDALPIDEEFKFEERLNNLNSIRNKIDKMFINFESEINNFENYRKILKNEKNIFIKQVDNIFN